MVPLFSGHAADEVVAVIERAGVAGRIAVVDDARLTRRIADRGRDAVEVAADQPLETGSYAAVVARGLARVEDWQECLASWCRAVVPGGVIVLVDRGQATELSRRALCGGLTDVAQRAAGRVLVTSGRWQPW
jgi:hypothetical protein